MQYALTSLLQRALAQESKSTALKPLAWLVGLCFVAAICAFKFESPYWIGSSFAVAGIVSVIFYLGAYVFFALKDRDALRSEKFYIQKLAIQKGIIGDDIIGTAVRAEFLEDVTDIKAVSASESKMLGEAE